MKTTLALLLVATLSACSIIQPKVDECMSYETPTEQTYCYLSKELTAMIHATAQSTRDGAITKDQARVIADKLRKADAYLDLAERLIITGETVRATKTLDSVKQLLLELR